MNQLDPEQTASLITGTRSSEYLWRQSRTAFNKELGFCPISSQRQVDKYRESIMTVRREDWNFLKTNIYQNKQGKKRDIPTETTVLLVKDLTSYIKSLAESESAQLDLSLGELPICIDADAGGGRFVATFTFLNRLDGEVKLHPYVLFEGSDCRKNMELTMGTFTEDVKNIEGKEIEIGGKLVKMKIYGLLDLCALNNLLGKQNHSSRFPCAWTNVSKDHLNSENHSQKVHSEAACKDIRFLDMEGDYEKNFTHHAVQKGDKDMAKSGKDFGSIVGTNLLPLINVFRYIPPVMHLVMGLANDVLKELVKAATKADEDERKNETVDAHHKKVQEKLVQLYEEYEDLEAQHSNASLAKMVVLNDIRRVPLLREGKVKEASEVSKENYNCRKKTKKNPKQVCDADLCLIFAVDVENDWDQTFRCKNNCKIHMRCEGLALIEEGETIEDDYECFKCRNTENCPGGLEKKLKERNAELSSIQSIIGVRMTSTKSEIDHHEFIEEKISGPRQRKLKESMKVLGDIARYHGGDLQGKQVQKLLDDARDDKKFDILKCIEDDKLSHDKFSKALTILADVSDALKMTCEEFDDHDVKMIQNLCEEWGKLWPDKFSNRNITPKGHILSFVLPKTAKEIRTFYRFYKVEQRGESIHADFNDIDRKAWVIKSREARLWKLIERYEMRNITNVDIVKPLKRVFRLDRQRQKRYI